VRLEEVERDTGEQASQAESLQEMAAWQRQQVEQLLAFQDQLGRLSGEVTSTHLEAAQTETDNSLEAMQREQEALEQKRQALLIENQGLLETCEAGIAKTKKALSGSELFKNLAAGVGAELLKIGAGVVTGVLSDNPNRFDRSIDQGLQQVTEATQQHLERLEATKKQLLENRKLLGDGEGIA
jgi:uncharacterized membrane protein